MSTVPTPQEPAAAAVQQWVNRLQQGDEKALEWLFEHYYRYLVVSAYNILQDDARAKDLVQDVFFNLWTKRADLGIINNIKGYLRRSVVNKAIDELRSSKRMSWRDEWTEDNSPATTVGADDELAAVDLEKLIHRTIEALPERCKLIFSLSRFEQMSRKEIAEQLDISIKTVENQMTKALKLIRAAVERYQSLWLLAGTLYIWYQIGVRTIPFVL